MNAQAPAYYTRLAPFRNFFEQGNPILTYHKLGPRPRRARLKGLYLSANLFKRQLGELHAAGFRTGTLDRCAGAKMDQQVVITFDDGYVNVLRYGLEALVHTGFRAIQFLPADLLGKHNQWDVPLGEAPEQIMEANQVREWLSAGHDIGSHTLSHPYLTRLSPERAREEVRASRKKLEDLFGRPILHFCYPYGDWNQAVSEWVREAGYQTACTTVPGVNTPADSAFALKRFTARYPSRNLKQFWYWLRGTTTPPP